MSDTETYSGVRAVAEDRTTPYLKAGKRIPADATTAGALKAAGLDWTVKLEDVMVRGKALEHRKAVVRQTDGHVFDVVGTGYTCVQNLDALGITDDLREDGGFKFIAAGELAFGRVVWTALEAPEGLMIGGVDAYGMTLLVETSHDGKRAVRAHIAPVRFDCKNVTNVLYRTAIQRFAIQHTARAPERLEESHKILGLVEDYKSAMKTTSEKLLKTNLTARQIDGFLKKLLPERPSKEKEMLAIKAVITDSETNAFGRGTAYAALNGVREYYDHVRGSRTGESAFIGAFTGVNYNMTNKALELLEKNGNGS